MVYVCMCALCSQHIRLSRQEINIKSTSEGKVNKRKLFYCLFSSLFTVFARKFAALLNNNQIKMENKMNEQLYHYDKVCKQHSKTTMIKRTKLTGAQTTCDSSFFEKDEKLSFLIRLKMKWNFIQNYISLPYKKTLLKLLGWRNSTVNVYDK